MQGRDSRMGLTRVGLDSRSVRGLFLAASIVLLGCVSTSIAPPEAAPPDCELDERLPGVWTSKRSSQLGPASMRLSFRCDCTYTSRARVLLSNIRERGAYWVEGENLHFTRASGETTAWPMRFEGDRLVLEEAPGEEYSYEAQSRLDCDLAP